MKGCSTEFFGTGIQLWTYAYFECFCSVPVEFSFPRCKTSQHILLLLLLEQHSGWCTEDLFAGNLASDLWLPVGMTLFYEVVGCLAAWRISHCKEHGLESTKFSAVWIYLPVIVLENCFAAGNSGKYNLHLIPSRAKSICWGIHVPVCVYTHRHTCASVNRGAQKCAKVWVCCFLIYLAALKSLWIVYWIYRLSLLSGENVSRLLPNAMGLCYAEAEFLIRLL